MADQHYWTKDDPVHEHLHVHTHACMHTRYALAHCDPDLDGLTEIVFIQKFCQGGEFVVSTN